MKALVIAWLIVLGLPGQVEACSCVASTVAEQIAWSDDVFVGTVLSLKPFHRSVTIQGHRVTLYDVRARLRVERSWKGPHRDVAEVITGSGGGDCGVGFQPGQLFLVFAGPGHGDLKSALVTNICTGSLPMRWAAESIDSLGTPLWVRFGGHSPH